MSLLSDISVSQKTKIQEFLNENEHHLHYDYPWEKIEKALKIRGIRKISVFGYGSLINPKAALLHLRPEVVKTFTPAVCFGVKRIFDYEMPEPVRERYSLNDNRNDRALLNVYLSKLIQDCCNGVIFQIEISEINDLRRREIGYDLSQRICLDWNDLEGELLPTFVLNCTGSWQGKELTNREILPYLPYLNLCIDGAKKISKDFVDFWLRSTFLADKTTRIMDYYS